MFHLLSMFVASLLVGGLCGRQIDHEDKSKCSNCFRIRQLIQSERII